MEKNEIVYLARVFGYNSAENFENYLQGDKSVTLGKERGEIVVTEMVEAVNISKAQNTTEAFEWLDNAKKTSELNSYFFVSENIEEVLSNIVILNNEPVDESAYEKIENHKDLNRFDYFGNGKVSMCVLRVDSEYLNELITQGYGEKRVGTYGTNLDKIQMEEIVLGDDGLKKVLSDDEKCEIVVYDEIHNAFNFLGMDYDKDNLFENDYTPEVVIRGNELVDENANEEQSDDEKDEISRARQQIEDMLQNGLITEDDYNLMIEALGDISQSGSSEDDGDDPDCEI